MLLIFFDFRLCLPVCLSDQTADSARTKSTAENWRMPGKKQPINAEKAWKLPPLSLFSIPIQKKLIPSLTLFLCSSAGFSWILTVFLSVEPYRNAGYLWQISDPPAW